MTLQMSYILAFILAYPVPTFIILCVLLFGIPFIIGRRRRKRILNGINEMRNEIKDEIKSELKDEIKDDLKNKE